MSSQPLKINSPANINNVSNRERPQFTEALLRTCTRCQALHVYSHAHESINCNLVCRSIIMCVSAWHEPLSSHYIISVPLTLSPFVLPTVSLAMGSHRQCQLILGFFAILIMEISSSAAFIVPDVRFVPSSSRKFSKRLGLQDSLALRGGNQDESEIADPIEMVEAKSSGVSVVSAFVLAGAECYSSLLEKTPIFTKSATAGLIFAASDVLAQRIERNADKGGKLEKTRTITASLVGFLYFGPAAHFWYEHIFILFPGTTVL